MFKKLFDIAYNFMLENEGWFSNDSDDPGGMTIFGISLVYHPIVFWKVYRAFKKGNVDEAKSLAKEFYYKKYWNELYEEVICPDIAIRLFDVSINIGKKRAIKILQKIVGTNQDGLFGPITLKTVNEYKYNLYHKYVITIKEFYLSRRKFKKFGKGWLNRLNKPITN